MDLVIPLESQFSYEFNDFMKRLSRNDPAVTEVNCSRTPIFGILNSTKAERLGSSLTGNSVVSTLHVPLRLLQNSPQLDRLLRFIEASENLATVHLSLHNADPLIVSRFFRAIGASRNPRSLILAGMQSQHLEPFASLLGSRLSSVDRLELSELRFDSIVTTDQCANIIATNSTVKCLKIHYCESSMELLWYNSFLERLAHHPALEKLSLSNSRHVPASAAQTLMPLQKLPSRLQTLELIDFRFKGSGFGPVSAGLRSSRAIQRLQMSRCTFLDQVAAEDFEHIFRAGGTGGSAIRSLQIAEGERGFGRRIGEVYPEGGLLSRVLLICSKDSASMPQLEEISIFEKNICGLESERYGFKAFFGSLEDNALYVKLRKLHFSQIDGVGLQALTRALPKLIHLKCISISILTKDSLAVKDDFIRGLRKNGSLEHMNVGGISIIDKGSLCSFTRAQRCKVDLFRHRNCMLPKVLTKSSLKNKIDNRGRAPVAAFPKLFHCAQQTPGTGPTWILAGLLSLEGGPVQC